MQQNKIKKEGIIQENLPNTMFRVRCEDGTLILAHLAGRLRLYYIKILLGDKVIVELSPYDQTKGRIVQRLKH